MSTQVNNFLSAAFRNRQASIVFRQIISQLRHYTQKRKVERAFPFMRNFHKTINRELPLLNVHYKSYVSDISSADMAISLKTAILLRLFCEATQPQSILDLGSGFSSFIFRSYASSKTFAKVCSVDDDPDWLLQTKNYLASHNLPTDQLLLWDQFKNSPPAPFDFIFHDLGNMHLRKQSLDLVLALAETGQSPIILDDLHKSHYAQFVRSVLNRYVCRFFDLCYYTLDEHGRFCGLVWDISKPSTVADNSEG
jgi:hypothetical protein